MFRASRIAEQRSKELLVLFEDVEFGMQQHYKAVAQGASLPQLCLRDDTMLTLNPLVVGHHQRFLAGKIVIGEAEGYPNLDGHLSHGRLIKAVLAEQSNCRVEDTLACGIATADLSRQRCIFRLRTGRPGGKRRVLETRIEHVQY